jgi:vacuolar-type H+-ATPase subunit H
VQEAEEVAGKKIEDARHKGDQIREEASNEADLQQTKVKDELEENRKSRWQVQKEEESKNDEKAKEQIKVYLDRLRKDAYQKADKVAEALILEIRES